MRFARLVDVRFAGLVLALLGCTDAPSAPRFGDRLAPEAEHSQSASSAQLRTWTIVLPTGGWQITEFDIPLFPSAINRCENGEARGINDAGWIVGHANVVTQSGACFDHAFLYRQGKQMHDLTPGAGQSVANGINISGVVVGSADGRPFRWTAAGGLKYLPILGDGTCEVMAVNRGGLAAGTCVMSTGEHRAALWSTTGRVRALDPMTDAYEITDDEVVVGSAVFTVGQPAHAVTWNQRVLLDYGTMGQRALAKTAGAGVGPFTPIVGNFFTGPLDLDAHAVFAPYQGSPFIPIPTLGGSENSAADFNGHAIVGWSWTLDTDPAANPSIEAFYWSTPSGTLRLSNATPPGFFHAGATAINANDEIVGWRTHPLGLDRLPVMWTVTPLP